MFASDSDLYILKTSPNDETYLGTINAKDTFSSLRLLQDNVGVVQRPLSIKQLDNGNFVYLYVSDGATDTFYLTEYNATDPIGTIDSGIVTFSVTDDTLDMSVMPSGVIIGCVC